jgi:hypothetical protein
MKRNPKLTKLQENIMCFNRVDIAITIYQKADNKVKTFELTQAHLEDKKQLKSLRKISK